jgi:hypothetical protein
LSNPRGAFLNNSIKVEEISVEKRSTGYVLGIWFAAICLGSMAGLLMHHVASVGTELKTVIIPAPPVKRKKAPPVNRLPVIGPKVAPPSPLTSLWPSPTDH